MKRSNRSTVTRLIVFDIAVLLSAVAVFALFPGRTARLITDFYPLTLAALCTRFSFLTYRSLEQGRRARRIWALLTAAMAFWTLAEITWALYDFVIRADTDCVYFSQCPSPGRKRPGSSCKALRAIFSP